MLTWTDEYGVMRRVFTSRPQYRIPSHAALRAYVYRRDDFTCQNCGARAHQPAQYDGRFTLDTDRTYWTRALPQQFPVPLEIDHVVSLRNGGTNHPDNLQALCGICNSAKSGLVDSVAWHASER